MGRFAKSLILVSLSCFVIGAPPARSAAPTEVHMPAPPKPIPEFFNPTYTDRRVDASCAASKMTVQWRYLGQSSIVTRIKFNGTPAANSELKKINTWLAALPGDVFARIECDNSGAVISFIEANLAGTPAAKQIRIGWISGRAELLARYHI